MPDFSTDVDIDPSDFVSECSTREKIELIDLVVEECADDSELEKELIKSIKEHFPQSFSAIIGSVTSDNNTIMHDEFLVSLIKLSEAYYRLSNEDIEKINELAKRF
jgi:oligoribonuclease (3'-5' exoribonuclease)